MKEQKSNQQDAHVSKSSPEKHENEKTKGTGKKGRISRFLEPVTKRVKKRLPKKKHLGPSGQEWDI